MSGILRICFELIQQQSCSMRIAQVAEAWGAHPIDDGCVDLTPTEAQPPHTAPQQVPAAPSITNASPSQSSLGSLTPPTDSANKPWLQDISDISFGSDSKRPRI